MFCELTAEQRRLRDEIRTYFAKLLTPDLKEVLREHAATPVYKEVVRQMGRDGYLAVGWPTEYGGRGFGPVEQFIFVREVMRAGAPFPFLSLSTVGPALMANGSPAHKAKFLPGIARGEIHFSIGYTEPGSGTDLASLKTRAVRDGDHFIVNGNKLFTSQAEGADYIWLAVRTDDAAPKHKGITILIVDTKSPGFSFTPIETLCDLRTNVTYYNDVRVPADMVVGEVNGGWKLITSQLNHERIGIAARGVWGEELYNRTVQWAQATDKTGRRPIDNPTVKRLLASAYARLETLRLLNYRLAWSLQGAQPSPAFASAAKVQGVETLIAVYRDLLQAVGLGGLVRHGSPAAILAGDIELHYRKIQLNTFGGGSGEVMREMISTFGLGLPRTSR